MAKRVLFANTPAAHAPGGAEPALLAGDSAAMVRVRELIERVAVADTTVLVTGETGTGKELAAQMIHRKSVRSSAPFVCINCAAVPESLLESELFGHERGSFTGAHLAREGRLAAADGGTAFLDEIGDMSAYSQAAVLRAIETRQVEPIGGRRPRTLDVRFVAATHQDLEELIREHRFRADLFFRVNVVRIELPPLRERVEDIGLLADRFIAHFNAKFGRRQCGLGRRTLDLLARYPWPGNVRELRNLIESSFVHASPGAEGELHLPPEFDALLDRAASAAPDEKELLVGALQQAKWNKSRAATLLRCSRMTLYRKMAKHAIAPNSRAAAG